MTKLEVLLHEEFPFSSTVSEDKTYFRVSHGSSLARPPNCHAFSMVQFVLEGSIKPVPKIFKPTSPNI
jgi:hypothetical protein